MGGVVSREELQVLETQLEVERVAVAKHSEACGELFKQMEVIVTSLTEELAVAELIKHAFHFTAPYRKLENIAREMGLIGVGQYYTENYERQYVGGGIGVPKDGAAAVVKGIRAFCAKFGEHCRDDAGLTPFSIMSNDYSEHASFRLMYDSQKGVASLCRMRHGWGDTKSFESLEKAVGYVVANLWYDTGGHSKAAVVAYEEWD